MSTHVSRRGWISAVVFALACGSTAPPQGSLRFKVDAPFCGGSLVQYVFLVDGSEVGREMLRHNDLSKLYSIPTGPHVVKVNFTSGNTLQQWTITNRGTAAIELTVELYCS